MRNLVDGWINAQGVDIESHEYDDVCWAIDELYDLAHDEPNRLLEIIAEILAKDSSEQVIGALGSGVLEELLVHHGETHIIEVVKISEFDQNFKRCLNYTYLDNNDVSPEVYKKFTAIKEE